MSFAFDFSGDDIDNEYQTHAQQHAAECITLESKPQSTTEEPVVAVVEHELKGLLSSLPDQIAYSTTHITSPTNSRHALIPRRALFDVRMQLMAEADPSSNSADIQGIGNSDITSNVYEGGFKSWEGAVDLARFVLDRSPGGDVDELAGLTAVIELGCGTALPLLTLFQHALAQDFHPAFTLADYNASVLRLVTLPNILLVWALHASPESFRPALPGLDSASSLVNGEGELVITPELLDAFVADLTRRNMRLSLYSGPWSLQLIDGLTAPLSRELPCLVLAAETIYNPASLSPFADVLRGMLAQSCGSKAIVAAKRVYFGVGGGVDAFKEVMASRGGTVTEARETGIDECKPGVGGVGRCLLEVQMA